jgi:HlyD family secretion protein
MSTSSPLKRRRKPGRIIAVVLIVLAGGAYALHARRSAHPASADPKTVQAHTGDIRILVSETGTIQPVDKVDIRSKVAGRLVALYVQEGQQVKQGQLIAVVDRSLLDPQIARQQATLDEARARLQQSITSYNLQVQQSQTAIAQARTDLAASKTHLALVAAGARPQEVAKQQQAVNQAQITLDDAQRTLKRKQSLVARGFIPQQDVDTAQVAVDTAKSNLDSAQQQLSLVNAGPRKEEIDDARSGIDQARVRLATAQADAAQDEVRKADIEQARAGVQQAEQDLAQLQVNLADTKIVAPASGIVMKRYKQLDEIVQSATTGFSDTQSLIVTLGSRQQISVDVNEIDVPKVRLGAPVTIRVDAVPNATFSGSVTEIAPASTTAFSDTSNGSSSSSSGVSRFSVKIVLKQNDPRLRPGMSASVDILSAEHKNAVLLPLEALPSPGDTATVTVVGAGGRKETRNLKLGLRNDTSAEVVSGLKAGENVAVPPSGPSDRRTFQFGGD